MWRIADKLWWMLFGIFCAADFAIGSEALREEGGSMPIAVDLYWPFTVGGLVIFGLMYWMVQHELKKITAAKPWWPDAASYDESKR